MWLFYSIYPAFRIWFFFFFFVIHKSLLHTFSLELWLEGHLRTLWEGKREANCLWQIKHQDLQEWITARILNIVLKLLAKRANSNFHPSQSRVARMELYLVQNFNYLNLNVACLLLDALTKTKQHENPAKQNKLETNQKTETYRQTKTSNNKKKQQQQQWEKASLVHFQKVTKIFQACLIKREFCATNVFQNVQRIHVDIILPIACIVLWSVALRKSTGSKTLLPQNALQYILSRKS